MCFCESSYPQWLLYLKNLSTSLKEICQSGVTPPPSKKRRKKCIDWFIWKKIFSFTFLDLCWVDIKEKLPKGWMSDKNWIMQEFFSFWLPQLIWYDIIFCFNMKMNVHWKSFNKLSLSCQILYVSLLKVCSPIWETLANLGWSMYFWNTNLLSLKVKMTIFIITDWLPSPLLNARIIYLFLRWRSKCPH